MFSLLSKELAIIFLIVITGGGIVLCGGCKTSPRTRTSSIVQVIFYCWSFEISGNILRIYKLNVMFRTIFQSVNCFLTQFLN